MGLKLPPKHSRRMVRGCSVRRAGRNRRFRMSYIRNEPDATSGRSVDDALQSVVEREGCQAPRLVRPKRTGWREVDNRRMNPTFGSVRQLQQNRGFARKAAETAAKQHEKRLCAGARPSEGGLARLAMSA